jgi:hypothetical protein
MELLLKNISPKDYNFIFNLVNRLGIKVEEKPDYASIIDDLKDAVDEIKMVEAGKSKLQSSMDLIKELLNEYDKD